MSVERWGLVAAREYLRMPIVARRADGNNKVQNKRRCSTQRSFVADFTQRGQQAHTIGSRQNEKQVICQTARDIGRNVQHRYQEKLKK
jgi:hypothetical protein